MRYTLAMGPSSTPPLSHVPFVTHCSACRQTFHTTVSWVPTAARLQERDCPACGATVIVDRDHYIAVNRDLYDQPGQGNLT